LGLSRDDKTDEKIKFALARILFGLASLLAFMGQNNVENNVEKK